MQNEQLYFRELNENDVQRLFEIYSNVDAMRYRESKPMYTIKDAVTMLERDQLVKKNGYEFRFAIIRKDTEELIGTVMFQPVANKAIIGYSIDEKFWNKGFGSAVVKILVDYLKTQQYDLLEAWVRKENLASSKVLEKNQFSYISQTIYPNNNLYQYKIK